MELEILRAIQSIHNPFLDVFFEAITLLGEEIFVVCLLTYLYWCKNKNMGEYMLFSLFASLTVNGVVKDIFRFSRPIGEEGIRTLRAHTATGFSFPSGHTQTVSTFFTSICLWFQQKWLYLLSGAVMLLVALSRLYLGVHYPKDVLVGLFLGIVIPIICYKVYYSYKNLQIVYYSMGVIAVLLLFVADSADYLKTTALLIGFCFGIHLEKSKIHFSTDIKPLQKLFRWIFGLVMIGGVMLALKAILPATPVFIFIRYFALSFTGIALYPLLFSMWRARH